MLKKRKTVYNLTMTALCAALISVSAVISIPTPIIPVTLGLFGIYFSLYFLGGKYGTIAVTLYVAIGALGLPVFSGFSGGVGKLFDTTGGYIWGYIIISLVYWLLDTVLPKRRVFKIINTGITLLILYLSETFWYSFLFLDGAKSIITAFSATALPFIPFDIMKAALSYILAERLKKIIRRHE